MKKLETRIVEAIIYDLDDRRGLGQEWRAIDHEIKSQIRAKWRLLIRQELRREKASKEGP